MAPTRRAALALGAGILLAGAAPLRRVLFLGNSFLLEHDVPALVAARAAAEGREIAPHLLARGGARLALHWARAEVRETLAWGWEAVVLQDHSTEALHEGRRAQSAAAIRALARAAAPAAVVLAVPWARAPGHPLYRRPAAPGYAAPRSPAEMTRAAMAHFAPLAEETGAALAPIAPAFLSAMAEGRSVHRADRYHASAEGARLAAAVIWRALSPRLP